MVANSVVAAAYDRLLFLLGVVVGDTIGHWGDGLRGRRVALLGAVPICQAWEAGLAAAGVDAVTVAPDDLMRAYVAALAATADRARSA